MEESSRWYPGAGLYRPVTLTVAPRACIDLPQSLTLALAPDGSATLAVSTLVNDDSARDCSHLVSSDQYSVAFTLTDAQGRQVASHTVSPDMHGETYDTLTIARPQLWTPEQPTLYTLAATLYDGTRLVDRAETRTGIRTVKVDSVGGFQLNGAAPQLKGVCLHHDLAPWALR